jgi:rRNA pseudouridine-1189 N-methylase Emg1 (Nep1/Mra1 family)
VIGGFPHGFFGEEVYRRLDEVYSIYPEGLEAWVAASRILCWLELRAGLYPVRNL